MSRRQIPERDWQKYRNIHPAALERFCKQILEEIEAAISDQDLSYHKRYLKIYKLTRKRDRVMGQIFDDYRRSTALLQLGAMNSYGLLTQEEIESLSEETQQVLYLLKDL